MSLTKLLKAPIKLFKKDVISFLIIRRHDVGVIKEKLRYIAVKPGASMSVLREKIWYLLDLPDYCEEIIILKNENGAEINLMELGKGCDPQHPFLLEVWPPNNQMNRSHTTPNTMLTMGDNKRCALNSNICFCEEKSDSAEDCRKDGCLKTDKKIKPDSPLNPRLCMEGNVQNSLDWGDKKCELSRTSSSSLFQRLHRKKSDNLLNILLKIQSDLNTLNSKISILETRIPD